MAQKNPQNSSSFTLSKPTTQPNYFYLKNIKITHKLTLIVAVFSSFIFLLLFLSNIGMGILSDVRIGIAGKEVWAIARRDAVIDLERYVSRGEEADYQHFLKNVRVPLGDRKAFAAILSKKPDLKKAVAGFVEGGIDPFDARRAALIFLRFGWISYVRDSISAWQKADSLLDHQIHLGAQIHQEMQAGTVTNAKRKSFQEQIKQIHEKTVPWEVEFDHKLALYGRALTQILIFAMIFISIVLLVVGVLFARLVAWQLMREISELQKAATKIAEGNFGEPIDVTSKDEIGDLARNLKQMALQRQGAEKELSEHAHELALANKKLLDTERMKDDFFATVSHELRTPLTLVLTPLESLLMGDPKTITKAQREVFEIMHNNAIRLLQMVTGLLDFSKIEAGRMEIKREPTDIAAVTRSIISDFEAMLKHKKITSRLDVGEVQTVLMDRYIYERILFNLLSNAAKFTPEGGSIGVSVGWKQADLTLSVSDTGIGISQEDQKRLFEKFRQIEGVSTRRFEGTGLGLALVKEFAGHLGGTVSVVSEVGKGSTFTVHCQAPLAKLLETDKLVRPRQKLVQQFHTHSGWAPTDDSTKKSHLPKILIAEDNLELASYLALQMQDIAQIQLARDGEKALETVRSWMPDLVLSDVMMPERDGLSLCREIKADKRTSHIPVILLTALTYREALLKGWEAGADEYLFKPFHPTELITRVSSVLSNSQERRKTHLFLKESHEKLELEVQERTVKLSEANKILIKQKNSLEKVNRELDGFVYTASHDLRAPLRVIASFSEVLTKKYSDLIDEQGKGYLNRIEKAAVRMSQLIDDLMLVARLSKIENPYKNVLTKEILESVLSRLDFDIKEARVEVVIQKGMPVIFCDKVKIEEVFFNLISNAVKFSRAKKSTKTLKIEVGHRPLEDSHEFYVKDRGIGISASHQERAFDIFWQLEPSASPQSSGVGLSIVKRLVQDHGGQVRIDSTLGEGAAFYFTLPLEHRQAHELEGLIN